MRGVSFFQIVFSYQPFRLPKLKKALISTLYSCIVAFGFNMVGIAQAASITLIMPSDVSVECDKVPTPQLPTATTTCEVGSVALSFREVRDDGDCDDSYTLLRIWTASDLCNNVVVDTQLVKVSDTTPPEIWVTHPWLLNYQDGDTVFFECDVELEFDQHDAWASDNCDTEPTVRFVDYIRRIGVCNEDGYLMLMVCGWEAEDDCGNVSSISFVFVIVDRTPPVIGAIPDTVMIECDNLRDPYPLPITDNCSERFFISTRDTFMPGDCEGESMIMRTWVVNDHCGNETTRNQVILVRDTTPPSIAGLPNDTMISCDAVVPPPPVVIAIDNCSSNPTVSLSSSISGTSCETIIERRWTAVDSCGNSSTATQIITIRDTTAPHLTYTPPSLIFFECDDPEPNDPPVFEDNCDNLASITAISGIALLDCGFRIEKSWTATDLCGNSRTFNQILIAIDTTAPILVGIPADTSVVCHQIPIPFPVVSAVDNCDTDVEISVSDQLLGTLCVDLRVVRTWTATDTCGNSSTVSQIISIFDNVPPVFTTFPADITAICDNIPAPESPTVVDNCASFVQLTFSESRVDGNCPGNYILERTWIATDECGNVEVQTQNVTVIDTVAPIITFLHPVLTGINDGDTLYFSCENLVLLNERDVVAIDNCSGATVDFSEDITGQGNCLVDGFFQRMICTWTATDDCGNQSSKSIIVIIGDTLPPVITQIPGDLALSCGDTLPGQFQVFATDNCNAPLDITMTEIVVPGNCVNNFVVIRTWTATDACGNQDTETQRITVTDNTPPVFGQIPADTSVSCENVPLPPVVVANGSCDTLSRVNYSETRVDGNCPVNYQLLRRWVAIDACGNTDVRTQTITVYDLAPPSLIFSHPDFPGAQNGDTLTMSCDNLRIFNLTNVAVSDNCDANPTVNFLIQNVPGDCATDGYLVLRSIRYRATDHCGNETNFVIHIKITDTTPPVLTGVPADLNLSCGETIPTPPVVTGSDNCNANIPVRFNEITQTGACAGSQIITRIWSAEDNCGNTISSAQVIIVADSEPPSISVNVSNVTVACDSIPGVATPVVNDNCDQDVQVIYTETVSPGSCNYNYVLTRTWRATDDCGNTNSTWQFITVEDNEAPVAQNIPPDITVSCDSVPTADPGNLFVFDNCDPIPRVVFSEVSTGTDCVDRRIERTWTVSDTCGNTNVYTQIITVVDNKNPILTGVPADTTIECSNLPVLPLITASDDCDKDVLIEFSENILVFNCEDDYVVTRTWKVTDDCGNFDEKTQTITVIDTTAPVITLTIPGYGVIQSGQRLTVACDQLLALNDSSVVVTDQCDSDVDVVFIESIDVSDSCKVDGYLTFMDCRWEATDNCGNISTFQIYITVVDQGNPVLVNAPGDLTVDLALDEQVPLPPFVPVVDNCDVGLVAKFSEFILPDSCGLVITRTWSVEDQCGNFAIHTQTINVVADVIVDSLDTKSATCGNTDGSARILVHGEEALFDFVWTPNAGTPNATNNLRTDLPPGTYTVVINLPNFPNCQTEVTFDIGDGCDPIDLVVPGGLEDISCFKNGPVFKKKHQILTTDQCAAGGTLCLPIDPSQMSGWEFTIDGRIANAQPCNLLPIISYSSAAIPGGGQIGPYKVESWMVQGTPHSTTVANLPALVDWMNTVDPSGNWNLDVSSASVIGGATNGGYGKLTIRQERTGISSQLAPNSGAKYTGITLPMTPGLHDLTVTNKQDGCTESTRIELYCITVSTITKELIVGENDEVCLDFTQLPGEIVEVSRPWENAAIPCADIEWKPEEECLALTGKAAGIDKICVTACDNMGLCDSVFVILTVREKFPALRLYNGFSPNEDGVNDAFKIENIEYYPNHQLQIFNANGLMVFESTNYQNDWKGTWNGSLLAVGTYYYILKDGNGQTLSGYIQISR